MMFGRGFSGNYNCFGYGHFGNGWIFLIPLAILFTFIAVTYLLYSRARRKSEHNYIIESLKSKYVHGEITEEEYLKRKNVLSKK
ncbi:MAG: hypothetical protein COA82_05650 [Alkaliphilus sp.]|nr:MAG: hypothetical protein COA82_05650 [Alkaliphilus sp.]